MALRLEVLKPAIWSHIAARRSEVHLDKR